MSTAQNALLELKIVAISHLVYNNYLVLLGEEVSGDAKKRYLIKPHKYCKCVISDTRATLT